MKYDEYDILIHLAGYPIIGLNNVIIEQNLEGILRLEEELGLEPEIYHLVLHDDCIHDQLTVIWDLMQEDIQDPKEVMMEAHTKGSAIIKTGRYNALKKTQENLQVKNYKTAINLVEFEVR